MNGHHRHQQQQHLFSNAGYKICSQKADVDLQFTKKSKINIPTTAKQVYLINLKHTGKFNLKLGKKVQITKTIRQ